MRRVALLLALAVLLFVAPPAAIADRFGIDLGSPVPRIEPVAYHNCDPWPEKEREHLVKLVQVFRTWSRACVTQMKEMEALHAKYGEKGVRVVSVTNEHPDEVAAYVQRHALKHPVIVEKTDSARSFGLITGVPTAFLVDPQGKLSWKGNWAQECAPLLPPMLRGVRLRPRMPLGMMLLDVALREQRYAEALRRIEQAEKGKPTKDEQAALSDARDWILIIGMEELDRAKAPRKNGEYYETWLLLKQVRETFKGTSVGSQAHLLISRLMADAERRSDVKAGRAYHEALSELPRLSKRKAAAKLRRMLFEHRDTRFWRLAEARASQLDIEADGK